MKLSGYIKKNELYFRIILNLIVGILVAVSLSLLTYILLTERNFINNYNASKEIILENIEDEYIRLNNEIVAVLDASAENKYLHDYLTGEKTSTANMHNIVYHMNDILRDNHLLYKNIQSNLVVLSLDDNLFFANASNRIIDYSEMMGSQAVQNTLKNPEYINYEFQQVGFDSFSKDESFITISKALKNKNSNAYYGIAIISLSHSDFSSIYNTLIDDKINSIYVVNNADNVVVSSNIPNLIGQQYNQTFSSHNYLKEINLSIPNYTLVSIVNRAQLINQMYSLPILLIILFSVIIAISFIIMKLIKSVTDPIYDLTEKMKYVKEGSFEHKVTVRGSQELVTLISTYNFMLDDLNSYVEKLVELENKKREAELHALQLQINPHFIYNTLNTIKMLIITEEYNDAILGIDAFIRLLRNTVTSNDSHYKLLNEINYLKDYSYIQKMRYGKNILVDYNITHDLQEAIIPKLIIQPFIENAFFHGFSTRNSGFINVVAYNLCKDLVIEISDNGVGMSKKDLFISKDKKDHQTNKMTKLGTQNVDDRLKLLYGKTYGVTVFSELGKGTIVTLTLPLILQNQASHE